MMAGYIPVQSGEFSTGEATDYEYYTNWDADRYNDFWGFDFRATKRLSNRWMMNGSFTYALSAREGAVIRNQVHMSGSTLPNPNGHSRDDVDLCPSQF